MLNFLIKISTSSLFFYSSIFMNFHYLEANSQLNKPIQPALMAPLASKAIIADIWQQKNTIFAVGERGHILQSSEDDQFSQINNPADQYLTAITGDGNNHLWAVGHDSVVLSSSDNGKNWNVTHLNIEAESPLFDVIYLGNQTIIAIGAYGYTIKSIDNGNTWNRIRIDVKIDEYEEPEDSEPHYFAIRRLSSGNLLIACEFGKLAELSPAGELIQQIETGLDSSLFGLEVLDKENILIFGLRGRVYLGSINGNFRKIDNPKSSSLFGSFKHNNLTYLVGADGTLLEFKNNNLRDLSIKERIILTTGLGLSQGSKILVGSTNGFRTAEAGQ